MILKKMALYELFYRTLGNNKKEYKIASFIEKKKLIIRYGKRWMSEKWIEWAILGK